MMWNVDTHTSKACEANKTGIHQLPFLHKPWETIKTFILQLHSSVRFMYAHITGSSVFGPSLNCFLSSVTIGRIGAPNDSYIIGSDTPLFWLILSPELLSGVRK